tara:strand:- start:1112 stop:1345 length:234 start_codon:yes stop_codon:yes gene_type:complete
MSTQIKRIKGIMESEISNETINTNMSLTRFYGGSINGSMIQLTIENIDGYIQLTKEQSFELARTLLNSYDKEIYPSE